jgi:DNA replication licensing factor MCM6
LIAIRQDQDDEGLEGLSEENPIIMLHPNYILENLE